jgi:hypothetical protein
MNKQLRNQLDYAMALSAQNLNLAGRRWPCGRNWPKAGYSAVSTRLRDVLFWRVTLRNERTSRTRTRSIARLLSFFTQLQDEAV